MGNGVMGNRVHAKSKQEAVLCPLKIKLKLCSIMYDECDLFVSCKDKDGEVVGVFNPCYGIKFQGDLSVYPYMREYSDCVSSDLTILEENKCEDLVIIDSLIDEAIYTCCVIDNFAAQNNGFINEKNGDMLNIEIDMDNSNNCNVPFSGHQGKGCVWIVFQIKGNAIEIINRCVALEEAFFVIPGFSSICN